MDRRILLATDGRARSSLAVEYALWVAELLDADLEVVYVVDERLTAAVEDETASESLAAELEDLGERVIDDVQAVDPSVDITRTVETGKPHRVLLDAADGADLLVLGRDISGDHDPLSVSTHVIGRTSVPVLSVPENAPEPPSGPITTAMVPTDGSDYPERALASLSGWLDPAATVHGLYVVDASIYDLADAPRSIIGILREGGEAALGELAASIESEDIRVRRHIRRGQVTPTLLAAIDDIEPAVVAVGTRGRSAGNGPLLGSTTRAVLERAAVPVLVAG